MERGVDRGEQVSPYCPVYVRVWALSILHPALDILSWHLPRCARLSLLFFLLKSGRWMYFRSGTVPLAAHVSLCCNNTSRRLCQRIPFRAFFFYLLLGCFCACCSEMPVLGFVSSCQVCFRLPMCYAAVVRRNNRRNINFTLHCTLYVLRLGFKSFLSASKVTKPARRLSCRGSNLCASFVV